MIRLSNFSFWWRGYEFLSLRRITLQPAHSGAGSLGQPIAGEFADPQLPPFLTNQSKPRPPKMAPAGAGSVGRRDVWQRRLYHQSQYSIAAAMAAPASFPRGHPAGCFDSIPQLLPTRSQSTSTSTTSGNRGGGAGRWTGQMACLKSYFDGQELT